VIVGTPPSLTVNGVALVADPEGVVTLIGPDVAPAGTVTTTSVPDDDATTPALPPNVTVFWLGVALNPVPAIVTGVPTGPAPGEKVMTETVDDA
jgi:hypothetical protein